MIKERFKSPLFWREHHSLDHDLVIQRQSVDTHFQFEFCNDAFEFFVDLVCDKTQTNVSFDSSFSKMEDRPGLYCALRYAERPFNDP